MIPQVCDQSGMFVGAAGTHRWQPSRVVLPRLKKQNTILDFRQVRPNSLSAQSRRNTRYWLSVRTADPTLVHAAFVRVARSLCWRDGPVLARALAAHSEPSALGAC
jgi:hypothetical protein